MKKISALFLTLALLLALAVPAMAAGGEYLVDDADLLSSACFPRTVHHYVNGTVDTGWNRFQGKHQATFQIFGLVEVEVLEADDGTICVVHDRIRILTCT